MRVSPSAASLGMENVAEIAEGVCTITAPDDADADVTALPSVASVPLAPLANVTLPGALPVYPKTKIWLA
ncbi:MAG: hypothetical protein ACJ79H_22070 [Myxococcales bacterium]